MVPVDAPRCGLVGPGRARIGLGPFLARDLEAAGAQVVAVSGRDQPRTAAAARELAEQFGHGVAAYVSVAEMLAAEQLDGLVIASPIPVHLEALTAAVEAGVSVLCEKPLVAPEEQALASELVSSFEARELLLMENCIWPYVLPVLAELHPGFLDPPIERFEMRLSPIGSGRHMLVDSLSHFLSVIQHLVAVDATSRLGGLAIRDSRMEEGILDLSMELESPFPRLQASLYLERCESQPRPAWLAINGVRADRTIRPSDYRISFHCGGRALDSEDPLAALVRSFVHLLKEPDLDRARAEAAAIRERARLYGGILDAWGG